MPTEANNFKAETDLQFAERTRNEQAEIGKEDNQFANIWTMPTEADNLKAETDLQFAERTRNK